MTNDTLWHLVKSCRKYGIGGGEVPVRSIGAEEEIEKQEILIGDHSFG
jgi:hypothetical protein